jgi:hypothetical protein
MTGLFRPAIEPFHEVKEGDKGDAKHGVDVWLG